MRTFRDILNLLFIPSLLITVPYIFLCIPIFFGYIPFEVTFDSMDPTFKDGELVYYQLCKKSDIHENDFIIYDDNELENNRIFHRVIEVRDDGLVTKGDAQSFNDPNLLGYEEVVGKVSNIKLPAIGPYLKFAKSNIIVINVSIGVWILYLFINILIVSQDMKKKKAMLLAAQTSSVPSSVQTPTVNTQAPVSVPAQAAPNATSAITPATEPATTAVAAPPTPSETVTDSQQTSATSNNGQTN